MIGDLFDSPWKLLIVAAVLIVLFGAKKLPQAARSLGQSMRILKKEVQGLHEDSSGAEPATASGSSGPSDAFGTPTAIAAPAPQDQQAQLDALQRQLRDLQREAAPGHGDPAAVAAKP